MKLKLPFRKLKYVCTTEQVINSKTGESIASSSNSKKGYIFVNGYNEEYMLNRFISNNEGKIPYVDDLDSDQLDILYWEVELKTEEVLKLLNKFCYNSLIGDSDINVEFIPNLENTSEYSIPFTFKFYTDFITLEIPCSFETDPETLDKTMVVLEISNISPIRAAFIEYLCGNLYSNLRDLLKSLDYTTVEYFLNNYNNKL